jgi:hypothetical protein
MVISASSKPDSISFTDSSKFVPVCISDNKPFVVVTLVISFWIPKTFSAYKILPRKAYLISSKLDEGIIYLFSCLLS